MGHRTRFGGGNPAINATELWNSTDGGVAAPAAVSPDSTNLRSLPISYQVRSAASWSHDNKWVTVSGDEGKGTRVFDVTPDGNRIIFDRVRVNADIVSIELPPV